MPIPPGIDLKRKRAREHLNRLKSEVRRQLAVLDREGVIRETDPAGKYIWRLNAPPSGTDRASILVGDFVHNLRSVLDHIVWSLAGETNRRPLPEWPIHESEGPGADGFYPSGIMKIRTLPAPAKIIIESLQPYNGGNQPLLNLQRLDNTDKHRRLLTTPYGIVTSSFLGPAIDTWSPEFREKMARGEPIVLFAGNISSKSGRFEHGDEIASADLSMSTELAEQVKVEPTFQITLDEPGINGEVVAECVKMHDFVENVVLPKFKSLW